MYDKNKPKKIALAAGGTAGHLFPALALAKAAESENIASVLFTDARGREWIAASRAPVENLRVICAASPGKGGLWHKIAGIASLGIGFIQAIFYLLREKPGVVVGFGGYASAPTVMAAFILRIPVVVHEQNAILGRANRLCGKFARFIATSFASTQKLTLTQAKKAVLTGNPVRPEFLAVRGVPYSGYDAKENFRLLVIGGSQGAQIFSDTVPRAIKLLPRESQQKLFITQQARRQDLQHANDLYAALSCTYELQPFFADIAEKMKQAHLIVSRSGASSVSEILAAGRPSLLVPYPQAMDDHQSYNAMAAAQANAAQMLAQKDFTPERLAQTLSDCLSFQENLHKLAHNAKENGIPDAAQRLLRLAVKTYRLHHGLVLNQEGQEFHQEHLV